MVRRTCENWCVVDAHYTLFIHTTTRRARDHAVSGPAVGPGKPGCCGPPQLEETPVKPAQAETNSETP